LDVSERSSTGFHLATDRRVGNAIADTNKHRASIRNCESLSTAFTIAFTIARKTPSTTVLGPVGAGV
jgi:hypothetical protein